MYLPIFRCPGNASMLRPVFPDHLITCDWGQVRYTSAAAPRLSWLLNLRDLHFIGFVAIFADDGGISTLADVLHCEN